MSFFILFQNSFVQWKKPYFFPKSFIFSKVCSNDFKSFFVLIKRFFLFVRSSFFWPIPFSKNDAYLWLKEYHRFFSTKCQGCQGWRTLPYLFIEPHYNSCTLYLQDVWYIEQILRHYIDDIEDIDGVKELWCRN